MLFRSLPPNSPQAEQGIVGCFLMHPPCVDDCDLKPDAFFDLRNREIYGVLKRLWSKYKAFDLITVQSYMAKKGLLEQVGGVAYLSECQDSVPSAANLQHYIGIVREKYELRKIITTCTDVVGKIYDYTGNLDELKFVVQSDLEDCFSGGIGSLPEIISAAQFVASPIATPPEIIGGILHAGSKMVYGGPSKANKTWCLADLAISVSTGTDWLQFKTTRGKVLFLNFEIQNYSWQIRLSKIASAKGVELTNDLQLWNLRGYGDDYRRLLPRIIQRCANENFTLIVLDPIYKIYGDDTKENSSEDIARLLNALEMVSLKTGAAIAFGAHFAKGNSAGKNAIDRMSGSGVFARDPDTILVCTEHEAESAFTIEPILRNFAPVPAFTVRWNFPLMTCATDLDPSRLKQKPGKTKEHDPKQLLALIASNDEENPISISQWALAGNIKRQTLGDYLPEMRRKGWIKTIGSGTSSKQCITNDGKGFLKGMTP